VCPAKVPFFSQVPDHSDAFIPFEFKNSTEVQIGLLYSQPFMNSCFHFPIAVESANSNCDCDSHQPVPPIMPHPNASLLYGDSQCNHYHHSSTTSSELCTIFCCTALLWSRNRILLSTGCELKGETCGPFDCHAMTFGPKRSFQCHCHCTLTYSLNSIWLLHHLLHVTYTTVAASINQVLQSLPDWTCCTVMNTRSQ
jgi:hypothetical protein